MDGWMDGWMDGCPACSEFSPGARAAVKAHHDECRGRTTSEMEWDDDLAAGDRLGRHLVTEFRQAGNGACSSGHCGNPRVDLAGFTVRRPRLARRTVRQLDGETSKRRALKALTTGRSARKDLRFTSAVRRAWTSARCSVPRLLQKEEENMLEPLGTRASALRHVF